MREKHDQAPRVLAILPAFNEEVTIASVIAEIREKVKGVDICVVNDGSSDRTAEKARGKGVQILNHPYNMGIGVAVQTGFIYAARKNYDIAVQVDADGQHDPAYIENMVTLLQKGTADVVSGSRFISKNGYKSSFPRRLGILWFDWVNRLILGQRITDSTSGFRAFNRQTIEFLADNYPEDYPEPEVLVILEKAGFRVREIPVKMRKRQGGKSSIRGFKSLHYMIKVMLAILMRSLKGVKR
jgi:glycosyltransferase involved in cell wall biosynthesis